MSFKCYAKATTLPQGHVFWCEGSGATRVSAMAAATADCFDAIIQGTVHTGVALSYWVYDLQAGTWPVINKGITITGAAYDQFYRLAVSEALRPVP